MLKILVAISLLIVSNQTIAKSKCEREWNALKSVQSKLRHKSTEYLRNKEHRKHKKYQDCRKGKTKSSKKSRTKTYSSTPKNTYKKHYPNYYVRNTFNSSSVNVKAKFKGEKQNEWMQYYVIPKECISPKSTSKFARCLAERDKEAEEFSKKWEAR